MSVLTDLAVPYHQQENPTICGAAGAQMVLAYLGAGLNDQTDLYNNRCHDNDPAYYTSPTGLMNTLNDYAGTIAHNYAVQPLASLDAISRKIVWSIHHHQIPAVALCEGDAHWMVVRGFETTAAPSDQNDIGYDIIAFDMNDPAPAFDRSTPPPHGDNDVCGHLEDGAVPDHHLSFDFWQRHLMTGLLTSGGALQYLAVCDADPAPVRIGRLNVPAERCPRGRILPIDEARKSAVAGLTRFGLYEREKWKRSLAKATPGKPILVQRLDRVDDFYYIVPMQVGEKLMPVVVCIDARNGDYQRAGMSPHKKANILGKLNFDHGRALDEVIGQPINFGRKGRLTPRKEGCAIHPALVWRPCRESMSPYLPFFMFTIGNERIYRRVDGRTFTALHTRDRGI